MKAHTVIKARNLGKEYGNTRALFEVNLDIPAGSVIGVLGPNASGKTTLLKQMVGLQIPTWGTVETFGAEAARLDESQVGRIGYVSQENELLDYLTVSETIKFARAHYPQWDQKLADRLLKEFDLDENRRTSRLSVGMKQRLSIVLGVSHRPDLLLLDEPAASLDPVMRQDFLDLLMELVQTEGRTILISSHILTDVQKVIDKVLILDEGQVQCFSDLDSLQEQYHRITLNSLVGPLAEDFALTGLKALDRQEKSAVAVVHCPDPNQLHEELAALDCQYTIEAMAFDEIYRLIVTGGK